MISVRPCGAGLFTRLLAAFSLLLLMGLPRPGVAADFAVQGDRLEAGKLQGLRDYAVVVLIKHGQAGQEEILGYAQLHQTGPRTARLFGLTGPCAPRVEAPCAGIGPVPEGATLARLAALPFDATTRIAPPVDLITAEPLAPSDPLYKALAGATRASGPDNGLRVRLDPEAEILSAAYDGALWFGERASAGSSPMGLRWHPDEGRIELVLRRIVQAEEVAEVLANLSRVSGGASAGPVELRVTRQVADADRLAEIEKADPGVLCAATEEVAQADPALPSIPVIGPCDTLAVDVERITPGATLDINRIHIDSQFCVSTSHHRLEDGVQTVMSSDPRPLCGDCHRGDIAARQSGVERVFVVISEAAAGAGPLNLESVIGTCRREAGEAQPRLGRDPRSDFLDALSGQDATRRAFKGIGVSHLWVLATRWQVLP